MTNAPPRPIMTRSVVSAGHRPPLALAGIALIIVGVILVNLGGAAHG